MVRQANPVDFWRGLALVFIFINHIPGIYYSRFTHANYSLSDSADLFVFLAGWALRLMVGTPERRQSTWYLVLRLGGRAITLYAAQILITMIALAMLAGCAILLDNPLLLEWHNAAAVFHDPVTTHVGLALITHQLGYFDILPLYVVLMLMAPIIAIIDRYIAAGACCRSHCWSICATLVIPDPVPDLAGRGPVVLQSARLAAVFVLGFVMAREDGLGGFVRRHIVPIRWISVPIVLAGLAFVLSGWWPDPTKFPPPRLFFLIDKTFDTPPRLIQFLALIARYVGDLSVHPPGVAKCW